MSNYNFKKEVTMKEIKELIFLLFFLMILALALTFFAYENVNGDSPNCQDCHSSEFSGTSSWHTDHLVHASGSCAKCHTGVPGSSEVPTQKCGDCHSGQPCDFVNNHEAPEKTTCLTCHTECVVGPIPCAAESALGPYDPRLDTFRTYRDEVLAKSANGKKLISLYYRSSEDIAKLFEKNPALKQSARELLEAILPAVEKLNNQRTQKK